MSGMDTSAYCFTIVLLIGGFGFMLDMYLDWRRARKRKKEGPRPFSA